VVPESAATKRGTKRAVGGRAAVAGASGFPWLHELVLSSTTDQTWPSECLGGTQTAAGKQQVGGMVVETVWFVGGCGAVAPVGVYCVWREGVEEGGMLGESVFLFALRIGHIHCHDRGRSPTTLPNTIEGGSSSRHSQGPGGGGGVGVEAQGVPWSMLRIIHYGTKGVQRHKA